MHLKDYYYVYLILRDCCSAYLTKWLHITHAFGASNSSSAASRAFGAPRTHISRIWRVWQPRDGGALIWYLIVSMRSIMGLNRSPTPRLLPGPGPDPHTHPNIIKMNKKIISSIDKIIICMFMLIIIHSKRLMFSK